MAFVLFGLYGLRRFRISIISFLSLYGSLKVTLRLGGHGRTGHASSLLAIAEEMGAGLDAAGLGSFAGRRHSVRPSRRLPRPVPHDDDGRLRHDTGNGPWLVTGRRRQRQRLFLRLHRKPIGSRPDVRLVPGRLLAHFRHGYRNDRPQEPAILG